jgi:diguanylate cyclase (GGDEF)-like protein
MCSNAGTKTVRLWTSSGQVMRTLAQRAVIALTVACALFGLLITAVGVVGMVTMHQATDRGNAIAGDELLTSSTTAQMGLSLNAAYVAGESALLSPDPARRSRLISELYTALLPAADADLAELVRLHADDPADELADVDTFASQWAAVRNLLAPTALQHATATTGSSSAAADGLAAAYAPVLVHQRSLIDKERLDAVEDQDTARSASTSASWVLFAAIGIGLLLAAAVAVGGRRFIRHALRPEQELIAFADTLQLSENEEEAHQLLQRHLQRSVASTSVVVLNRNNSADRLEAVTPLDPDSELTRTLSAAEPRSCLAIRSARIQHQSSGHPGLLTCAVCASSPGNSTCTPLTVGGEVIGAVLLNRAAPFSREEGQRVKESVRQAAPVLANLRNLAIAETRAATDGLTGLPNKRAVTDTLKQLFAQSVRDGSPLALILLDLDHFKNVNDRLGHPIGDQTLAAVGAALRSVLRDADFAGRNGGEEFALVLPQTDVATAYEVAERVRLAIAEISLPGVDLNVTASLGVAGSPEHGGAPERLERLADAALYVAKRSGRNRTVVAERSADVTVQLGVKGDRNPVAGGLRPAG